MEDREKQIAEFGPLAWPPTLRATFVAYGRAMQLAGIEVADDLVGAVSPLCGTRRS
jgi:hypothetical protein